VALVADAILDCSARGDIVLDAFLGSGTTLIAAERTGRVCHGIELDPLYVDTAIRRWQRHCGDHAVHAASGRRFDEIAALSSVPLPWGWDLMQQSSYMELSLREQSEYELILQSP
jgi:hypothetical protein